MDETMIISDPNIMLGKPVIKGTRITVEHILRELAGGMTIEELLEAHPHITREGIKAALEPVLTHSTRLQKLAAQ